MLLVSVFDQILSSTFSYEVILDNIWFGLVWWTPSIGRKVGIPRGILPHVQTGYWESRLACLIQTIGNPDWSG